MAALGAGAIHRYCCRDKRRSGTTAIVARELEIRHIETACLSSYQAQDRGQVEIIKAPEQAGDGTAG